ncbi:hypothetical protein G647_08307 [Cladophialophora carrionii CBS 160.54]|uniref:Pentacotripeptide-repeat region of PRORP domain-containing protein n=1 Tax=Cladophialophora carrionii CBS 160.54 TaxID=1279043 RepID=V9D1V1_9EURO|nr:uncharacterized protein G647_08307 [Cladophialophora carrionii CBS 160.54]ETI20273.1 hypothetical protein G647_08307 [Cladophialophora carrionii CBS 160.54]
MAENDAFLQTGGSVLSVAAAQDPSGPKNNDMVTAGTRNEMAMPYSSSCSSRAEQQLREIIDGNREPKSTPTGAALDRAWILFNQIPDQRAHATGVFHLFAQSGRKLDQTRALGAFRLIDEENRTSHDYERAVRVAVQVDNYRIALTINDRATRRNLHQGCSVFLLLHAVSNQLWNTANTVWNTSFRRTSFRFNQTSPTRAALVREVGNYRDLPLAIHQLGSRLREQAPVIMQHSGTLQTLFNELLAALVRNGQLMSIITPQGLQNLFDVSYDLRRAVPSLYLSAIDTINKSAIRPDKGLLADAVYTNLRSSFPEIPPGPSTYGSLLSIHTEQGASAQTYIHYLNEFATFHGVADTRSYQKVLSALATQGDIDGVQDVFLRLCQAHGRPTEPAFYTPLLYVYARLGDVATTEREFQTMKRYGVKPTGYAWNILIYAHARSSQPEHALRVLSRMQAEGVTPDVYTFTTLIGVFARKGDTNAVLDILEKAQQNQVKGSYALITGLVQSYCLNDQAEAAERLAAAATTATFRGNPTTMWNYLLRHYAFLADSKSMLRVQQQMTALGVDADAMTHAAFMTALVLLGKTRDAVQILRTLNMSQTFAATSFHYAIILHGFAQEGDRDMANVIYQELVERFPRLGASPRLAMLHLQAGRNPIENERPKFAAQYLEEILYGLSTEERASRQPQPGLRRRRSVEAVPSLYVEYFVDLLMTKGQVKRAEQLVQRFEALHQSSYLHSSSSTSMSIPLLCARLSVQAEKQAWDDVEAIWRSILERAIQLGQPSRIREQKPLPEITENGKAHTQETPASLPLQPVGLPEVGLVPSNQFTFGSMIPENSLDAFPLDEPGLAILYSQRHLLEAPFNRYLNTLAVRQLQTSAIALVAKMEKVGFALTSKNWNMYIQIMTRSEDPEHWLLAYKLFERKMIAHTPPWPVLQRGKWLPPQESEGTPSVPMHRKVIEKRDPGQLMPTYYTAVHLASALLKANRLAAEGDNTIYTAIWKRAPLTCRYIRRMPYLKDRIQGLLLRNRKMRILPPRRPRLHTTPDRSGVLGSRSPADHVPVTELVGLNSALKMDATDTKSNAAIARTRAVRRAELYEGQIPRTQVGRGEKLGSKKEEQFERRVRHKEEKLLRTLQRMRRDVFLPRTVSDMYIGHPTIPSSVNLVRTGSPRQARQALYGTEQQRLIKEARTRRLLREQRRAVLRRILRGNIPKERTVSRIQERTDASPGQATARIESDRPG